MEVYNMNLKEGDQVRYKSSEQVGAQTTTSLAKIASISAKRIVV